MPTTYYLDVLPPFPTSGPETYTYIYSTTVAVPIDELFYRFVIVPLGRSRIFTGLVLNVQMEAPPTEDEIKYRSIIQLTNFPQLNQPTIKLWRWVASYYMCSLSEVMRAAVPAAFRSDQNALFKAANSEAAERLNIEIGSTITLSKYLKEIDDYDLSQLNRWILSGYIVPNEVQDPSQSQPMRGWITNKQLLVNNKEIDNLREKFRRSKECLRVLELLVEEHNRRDLFSVERIEWPRSLKSLSEEYKVSTSVINKLRDADLFTPVVLYGRKKSVIREEDDEDLISTYFQERQAETIFNNSTIKLIHLKHSHLLQRIPIALILSLLSDGKQILLLLPTAEAIEECTPLFSKEFCDQFHPYHSSLTNHLLTQSWYKAAMGEAGLYVGQRSAIWLPFKQLTHTFIIDEESSNYRQYEPAPRFSAREVALMQAQFRKSNVIMISAAPSIGAYFQSVRKRYELIEIDANTTSTQSSKTAILQSVSLPESFRKNKVRSRLLTFELIDDIRQALKEGGQALLLYQRKGYARQISCGHCGHTLQCPNCNVSYRYYNSTKRVVCPTCGHNEPLPHQCPVCEADIEALKEEGTGIERLIEEVTSYFNEAKVLGLESNEIDKESAERLSSADIILSPALYPSAQLLAGVTTLGIVQLDIISTLPDFRANEEAYELLRYLHDESPQLRRMVVQYLAEGQNCLEAFIASDYKKMFDHELEGRYSLQYPPFSRMIDLCFETASDRRQLAATVIQYAKVLEDELPDCTVMGPSPLLVQKCNRNAGYKLTLLHPLHIAPELIRSKLYKIEGEMRAQLKNHYLYYSVDPV